MAKNPLDRAGSYAKNLAKETKQFAKAWSQALDASDMAKYTAPQNRSIAKKQASVAAKKYDAAKGQLAGALLQGRRYSDTTGKQIKKAAPIVKSYKPIKKTKKGM